MGRIHPDSWLGDRSLHVPVPAMGPGVFHELPQGGARWKRWGVGRDGMAPTVRYRQGQETCKSGPRPRRWHALARDWRSSGISRGRVMVGHSGRYTEWRSYRSPACYGWARQPLSGVEGPAARDWGFTPSSVTHTSSEGGWGATVGRGCDGWTVRGPRPRSHWRIFARKGPPTSRWSWQPPSAAAKVPMRDGTREGGVGRRPYACWGCRSDGSPSGVARCQSPWRPTTATPQTTSSWQTMWNCRGLVHKGTWCGSGELYPLNTFSRGSYWPSVCGIEMWGQKKTLGGWRGADASVESKADRGQRGDGPEQGDG